MSGVGLVVGGWFASAAIRKFVDKAGAYLGDNHGLHKKTKQMLNNLKNMLPEMQAFLEEVEKQQTKNSGIVEWLNLVQDATYEAEDVLDDFEAKRIREENREGKVRKAVSSFLKGTKNFILADDDVRKLMGAVNNLEQLCNQCGTFVHLALTSVEPSNKGGKMAPILQHDHRLVGRDSEIKSILNIILGYEIESLENETISEEMELEIESYDRETISEKMDPNIRKLEHKIETLEREIKSLEHQIESIKFMKFQEKHKTKLLEYTVESRVQETESFEREIESIRLLKYQEKQESDEIKLLEYKIESLEREIKSLDREIVPLRLMKFPEKHETKLLEYKFESLERDTESLRLRLMLMKFPEKHETQLLECKIESLQRDIEWLMKFPEKDKMRILEHQFQSLECDIELLERATLSEEIDPEIESLEREIESIKLMKFQEKHKTKLLEYTIESPESEIESLRNKKLLENCEIESLSQNRLSMMRTKLFRWLHKIKRAQEFLQKSLTDTEETSSLDYGKGNKPEFSQMSSDRGMAASSTNAGLPSGVKIIELSSSQDKPQKMLLEMDPEQSTDNYGRPFIIPIVGISGIGKTALAQTIYRHQQLKDHFVLKKWFYLSHESDVNKMVTAFIPSFNPNDPCDLEKKFIKEIRGKRFLLVLDDVSSKVCSVLKNMRKWFSSAAYRSVILVTTQEQQVANRLGTMNPIILNPLRWDYFFQLLLHYAFQDANMTNEQKEALKPTCEVIGRPLPRLPLVAKTIGSLLRSEIDQERWKNLSRIHWKSPDDDHCIISILESCYKDLNSKLKQCFLLCSIFPPNYIIEKDRIIQMWIANNYIQTYSSEDSRLEDIGTMWFEELVNRSFFLPTPWPHKYIMHSAIRELAVAVFSKVGLVFDENPNPCPEGCFLMDEHTDPCFHGYSIFHNCQRKIPDTTRHLTLIKSELDFVPKTRWYDKLHTLLFYGYYSVRSDSYSLSMLSSTRKLRVLKLSYPGKGAERHIRSIGELSHLRFLDLSFTGLTELPESLCSLCHLQVLDIRGCEINRMPKKLNHLINLRHLYASNQTIGLVSHVGKLTLLQELKQFLVSNLEGYRISELAEMNEIGGHLSITNLQCVKNEDDARKARLQEKMRLKALSLIWNWDRGSYSNQYNFKVLNSLQPHSDLQKLEIVDYTAKVLPSWITHDLVNIKCIYLKGCKNLENLPPFGKLRHLETIIFHDLTVDHIGEELYGPDEVIFPALKVLKFVAMKRWTVWSPAGERKLLPHLEELQIRDCDNLRKTPIHSLKLSSLKKLELLCCNGILMEGSICDKPLPLLSSLYISGNQSCTIVLSYSNFPNLRVLSLEMIVVHFKENLQSLLNLKRVILSKTEIKWNGGPVLPELTELKVLLAANDISNMVGVLEKSVGDVIHQSPPIKVLNITVLGLDSGVNESEALLNYMYRKYKSMLEGWFARLPHLVELTVYNINIPDLSFATLVSLKTMHWGAKTGIQYIPEKGMPQNLKELYIYEASSNLEKRCCPEKGEDWPKIKHIPYIRVNEKTLQMV